MQRHTTASCFATYLLPHMLFAASSEERLAKVCCLAWNIGLFPDAAERERQTEQVLDLILSDAAETAHPGYRDGFADEQRMLVKTKRDLFPWRFENVMAADLKQTRLARRQLAFEPVQSGLVAFGAGLSDAAAFGTVSPDVVAFGLGVVPFKGVVFVAVPLGGVAFGAFGVCVPWEKAGVATERDRSGRATESSLRIINPFMIWKRSCPPSVGHAPRSTRPVVWAALPPWAVSAWSSASSWM